eukprot:TRINITY_DN18726_c0_g1_i1.p1 TRINITY_DN18726_c0_g1~~TRINITY_DN18726_c0_g1_i1.p1  ORF type:complete len:144 (+),score=30.25 TRINITY_DN18726_c0_g1_i1:1-432(+)
MKGRKKERKVWEGFKKEESNAPSKTNQTQATWRRPFWMKWMLLSLYSHSTWISMIIVLCTSLTIFFMVEFEVVWNSEGQTISFIVATWSLDSIIRIVLFNIMLITSKRVVDNVRYPFRSASFERRVIKMPLVTGLCDLEDNLI